MKKLKMKMLELKASKSLSREEMKNVVGGSGPFIIRPCFKCCPSDACSPVRHYCLDVLCPE